MKYLLALMLTIFSLTARAELFENWTDTEKVLYATSTLALIADYKSTSSVLYPHQRYRETNIFLGPQPSRAKLNLYFIAYIVANYIIADNSSHEFREKWLFSVTIVETGAAMHNVNIGAKIKF